MKRTIAIVAVAIFGFAWQTNAQTLPQIQTTPIKNSLTTVIALSPIHFSYDKTWIEKLSLKTTQSGFDIDSLKRTSPELIINQKKMYSSGKNNTKTVTVPKVDYEALLPLLVGSIQEQQQQIKALKAEIEQLKSKIAK